VLLVLIGCKTRVDGNLSFQIKLFILNKQHAILTELLEFQII